MNQFRLSITLLIISLYLSLNFQDILLLEHRDYFLNIINIFIDSSFSFKVGSIIYIYLPGLINYQWALWNIIFKFDLISIQSWFLINVIWFKVILAVFINLISLNNLVILFNLQLKANWVVRNYFFFLLFILD